MVRDINESALPAGWRFLLLDEVTKRGSGHTPNKDHPEYWNGGVKWISLSDSSALDKGYIFKTDKEISTEGIKNSSAVVHPAETVVLSRDAGVGKSAVMKEPMAVSQHFIAWRCDNDKVLNSWFLYNWLQALKPEFERQAVGSTIKTIGLPYFKKLKIALPPLPEQTKIAQILSTWDKAIATTEKLIGNSQQQKKALMQSLLTGKKRLPGFEGEFKYLNFSDVVGIDQQNLKNKTADDFSFKYISLTDVKFGAIEKSLEYISFKNAPSRARRILKEGDILLATVRPNLQGFARVKKEHSEMIASTGFSVLSPKKAFCSDYIFHYLYSDNLTAQIDSLVVGSNYPAINSSDVANLKIFCPEYNEQVEIAKVLNNCLDTIENMQKKLAFLKQEKAALMQQLLTGKRRVKVEAA